MEHYQNYHWVSSPSNRQFEQPSVGNKYIFVKNTRIHINPHFNEVSKVFINPNFKKTTQIHVNPNVIKCSQNIRKVTEIQPKVSVPCETPRKILISTKTKLVKVPEKCRNITKVSTPVRWTRSKYKLVNNSKSPKVVRTRHKIVNKRSITTESHIPKKRYVFVNKFTSMSFLANKVIFKNTKRSSVININGIMHQNTPTMLRRIVRKKKKKMVVSGSKLKKSNVQCSVYKKYGRCPGFTRGTCIKIHNEDHVTLCPKFLQGVCVKKNCLLSHKATAEKMPTCKYYLEGLCARDDCQYLHVKINQNAEICTEFLQGYCKSGQKCVKRHQFICPEFEKEGKCPRKKCEYPHVVQKKDKSLGKKKGNVRKKHDVVKVDSKDEKANVRYYEEVGCVEEAVLTERPKLGELPAFIPLMKK